MSRYRERILAGVLPLLVIAGCSNAEDPAKTAEVDTAAVSLLFAEGFNDRSPQGGAQSGEAAGQTGAANDARAGIPFERSRSVTGRVETAMAANLAKDFSLRFAIVDPAAFVRSGKARPVWERELTARGYSGNTLAGATALMFGVAWELTNGQKLSPAQNAAILRQVTAALRGNSLERENDEERQTAADIRLTAAGLWLEEAYLREPYPEQMRALSDSVHQDMLRMSNNDLRKTSVTAEGFSD